MEEWVAPARAFQRCVPGPLPTGSFIPSFPPVFVSPHCARVCSHGQHMCLPLTSSCQAAGFRSTCEGMMRAPGSPPPTVGGRRPPRGWDALATTGSCAEGGLAEGIEGRMPTSGWSRQYSIGPAVPAPGGTNSSWCDGGARLRRAISEPSQSHEI